MSSGNILVDDPLSPGRTYHLPSIMVTNTGDRPDRYEMVLSYKVGRQYRPVPAGWISFEPQYFKLDPRRAQAVGVTLEVPSAGAAPGDYFAFIESRVTTWGATAGGTAIATRLSFTLPPDKWPSGAVQRAQGFARANATWGYILLCLLGGVCSLYLFRRLIRITIGFGGAR